MPLMNIVFGEVLTDFSNSQIPTSAEDQAAQLEKQTNQNTYAPHSFIHKWF